MRRGLLGRSVLRARPDANRRAGGLGARLGRRQRDRLARALPIVLALAAALVAAAVPRWNPLGVLPAPALQTVLLLLATVAALHRPLGGAALGLGTLMLPIALLRLGVLPALLLAAGAHVGASAVRAMLRRRASWFLRTRAGASPRLTALPAEARPPLTVLADASVVLLATLAGALAWVGLPVRLDTSVLHASLLLPPLAYAAAHASLTALLAIVRGPRRESSVLGALPALLVDAAGWLLGALLVRIGRAAGWADVWPLLLVVALLAAEAMRNAFVAHLASARIADLEQMQYAHQRILTEASGRAGIAGQVLVECANVLPVHTFQLELYDARSGVRSWWAGPERLVREGVPEIPEMPPMLPGIHRRADWHVVAHALQVDAEPLGQVRLWCDPRQVEPGAEALLAQLVPHLASSIHRARLDREAKTDPLTGVPVRRVLDSRIQQVYRRSVDRGESFAVIMCDIDHFKSINDTHGHAAGDEALILVAQTLDGQGRATDLCCRYGGEEFTLLLPETNGEQALRLAERLRGAIERLTFAYDGVDVPLRLSIGVAAFPDLYIKTASELLVLADDALYQAKRGGRNRCLLNLGNGRFRDVHGAEIGVDAAAL
ncbi:MAG: GGDEF domain-containing protein [Acidobacteriota bacterium]